MALDILYHGSNMKLAQVVTVWLGDGTPVSNPYRGRVTEDHPMIHAMDVTAPPPADIPPAPNAVVFEIVVADDVMTAIEADPNVAILWSQDYAPE